MFTKFLQKTFVLITFLFFSIKLYSQQNFICKTNTIKLIATYSKEYQYKLNFTKKKQNAYIIIQYPKIPLCDTIIKDSVIYLTNDCGTGCISELVIFMKPKFYWNYFTDVYTLDYKQGVIIRADYSKSNKTIYTQDVRNKTFIDSITIGKKCPDFIGYLCPAAFFDSIKIKNDTLIIYPNKDLNNFLTDQFRDKSVVKLKIHYSPEDKQRLEKILKK